MRRVTELKSRWAGLVARQNPSKWAKKIMQSRPIATKRNARRLPKRWTDDMHGV